MKRALILMSVLALPATAAAQDLVKGKSVYTVNCMACHGSKGDGAGPAAQALQEKPTNFTTAAFWTGKDDDDVKTVIKAGKPGTIMAPFPQLKDDEVANLIAYLRSFEVKSEKKTE